MRKLLSTCFGILVLVSVAAAEPILTAESKCIPANTMELGLGVSYGVDTWKWDGGEDGDSSVSLMAVKIPAKYGITDNLELNLGVPYRSWNSKIEISGTEYKDDEAGLGQISIGGKLALAESFAAGLDVQMPTGDVDKTLGEGTNIGVSFIASGEIDTLKISGNAGYLLKMKYEDEDKTEWDPGDPLIIRGAVEYPIEKYSVIGEVQFQSFGKTKAKTDGGTSTDIADSNGSTLDFLVGGQYLKDAMKLKLGFEFAVGDENQRAGLAHFYDSWDWKVILAGAYKFEI
ncbi:MAG: transporter [Elusimicrobiota bacterium]